MKFDEARDDHLPSMDEVVAEFSAEMQRLRPTDARRLKLVAMIEGLEDMIARRGTNGGTLMRGCWFPGSLYSAAGGTSPSCFLKCLGS
jgi:hypothetical protein